MTVRPIIGTGDNQPTEGPHSGLTGEPSAPRPPESPLASQLPPWDLVPNDMLLVRRRPARP